ncbi:zinc-finger protein, partial [Tulasnella sp. 427]
TACTIGVVRHSIRAAAGQTIASLLNATILLAKIGTTMDDCNQCSGHTTGDLRASLAHSQPNAANVFNDFPELAYLAQAPPPSTSQLIQPIQTQRQSFPNSRTMLNSGFLEHLKPPAYSSPIGHHHMSEERKDIVCLWGACRDSFSTQAELIAHVNAIHLGDPSSSIPIPQASLLPTDHAQPQLLHSSCSMQPSLACHWGNCGLSPSSLQSGSMPLAHHQEFSSLSVLANHLLQDHLGLPLPANLESLIGMNATAQQANLLAVAPSLQVPQAPQNTSRTMTSPTLADSPTPMLTDLVPSPPPTASTLSPTPGTPSPTSPEHKCCWTGCGKTFDTVDDLSTHVVDQHVGGGKGVYSCRWEGCDRNGAKAFSNSYGTSAIRLPDVRTALLRSGDAAAASAKAYV